MDFPSMTLLTLLPGIPWKPVIPRFPVRPGIPFSPGSPCAPGSPWCPFLLLGSPGVPWAPSLPGTPGKPLAPVGKSKIWGREARDDREAEGEGVIDIRLHTSWPSESLISYMSTVSLDTLHVNNHLGRDFRLLPWWPHQTTFTWQTIVGRGRWKDKVFEWRSQPLNIL